jgi:hypothetical protein
MILPAYKSQQTFAASGPQISFTKERTYWIDYYLIPPIDQGTPVLISVTSSRPGSTWVFFAPFDLQTESVSGPSVVNEMLGPYDKGLVVFGRATKTSIYTLRISSWNSTYSVRIESRWSPFFDFRYGIVLGAALVPASLFLIYYDRVVEKRDRMFEKALREARTGTTMIGHWSR